MTDDANTLLLRLAGPMQSWGTSSRFELRRTDAFPSKSGVLGLLLCAKGVRREHSREPLQALKAFVMGVRVDLPGVVDWDAYHTAGAGIGIRSAEGELKVTPSTGNYETLLSKRQYLFDASFLVALHGPVELVKEYADALNDPVWPLFLGRKCCIPSERVYVRQGRFDNPAEALASLPWRPRIAGLDEPPERSSSGRCRLPVRIEHPPGTPPPDAAKLVYDVPAAFGFIGHQPRWVVDGSVEVALELPSQRRNTAQPTRQDPYGPEWPGLRRTRLAVDGGRCVFCRAEAVDVHHLDYDDVRPETLRSLCKLCHDACTMLEYGREGVVRRVDPADPAERPAILAQIQRLMTDRRLGRRRELLEAVRVEQRNASRQNLAAATEENL